MNKSIYVTGLPLDTDQEEIYNVFSKYGLIDESWDTDKPRIKMYDDERGEFKGEALIGKVIVSGPNSADDAKYTSNRSLSIKQSPCWTEPTSVTASVSTVICESPSQITPSRPMTWLALMTRRKPNANL